MVEATAREATNRDPDAARLNRDVDFRPLYKQIKDSIIQQLVSGDWRPGDKLPSEFELAARYGVSQGTVRKALDELTAQNLLVRQQGRGTFVATHNPHRALFHFFHLVGKDGSRQLPTSRVLSCSTRRATREEEEILGLRPGNQVIQIDRIRELANRPTIVERISLSAKRFAGLTKMPLDGLPNTLYELYEERYGITIYQAEEYLRAVAATEREAELLGVAPGHPLQEIARLAMSIDRTPVEWRVSHCLTADHHYVCLID
ncbi:MAG: GntR family transcriptional regulator [Rhodospirillales bacterium]|nr:GntR family transcriptional regulator [Rhodospirillales bacterium]